MKYKEGDRIYLHNNCGFSDELEGRYGYIIRVDRDLGCVYHTVENDDGTDIMVMRNNNEWRSDMDNFRDGSIEVRQIVEPRQRISKHSMV